MSNGNRKFAQEIIVIIEKTTEVTQCKEDTRMSRTVKKYVGNTEEIYKSTTYYKMRGLLKTTAAEKC